MNKQLFAIILSFATGVIPVLGQANLAQTEPSKIYNQGVELFEKKKYNLAYKYFDQ